jgi:hypothetical protein
VTTIFFGRPAQSVAVLACPLSPAAGLLREPHLVPVQPIRKVASSQGDAVHHPSHGCRYRWLFCQEWPSKQRSVAEACRQLPPGPYRLNADRIVRIPTPFEVVVYPRTC